MEDRRAQLALSSTHLAAPAPITVYSHRHFYFSKAQLG